MKKISAVILTAVMLFEQCSFTYAAEINALPETEEPLMYAEISENMIGGYRPGDLDYNTPVYNSGISTYVNIPSAYQSEASEYLSTRNQNPYGTCWAFSTIGCAEFDVFNKGLANASVDLSELQLVYYTFNSVLDPLGGTAGDLARFHNSSGRNFLNYGGNYEYAARRLAQWSGVTKESYVPYSQAYNASNSGLPDEYAYDHNSFLLNNAYIINIKNNADDVKTAIMQHGAVGIMYFHNSQSMVWSDTKNAWTYYDSVKNGGGHAVMAVGWDDNFSKDNFPGENKPSSNGAWLVRNSWGTYASYFWMSYETVSLGTSAWVFDFGSAQDYDNNYQSDGGLSTYYDTFYTNSANVFEVRNKANVASETLKSVQLSFSHQANVGFIIDIYTNLRDKRNPLSGNKQSQATTIGQTAYAGIYTIELENPVILNPGTYFSVVVSVNKNSLDYEQGIVFKDGETAVWECPAVSDNNSFYSTDGRYFHTWPFGNYCIKALTSNNTESFHTCTFNQNVADDRALKTAADCLNDAVYYKSCVCGTISSSETFISFGTALGHRWNGGVTTKEPTCTGQGKKTYTCTACKATRQESIAAKGHGETIVRNQKAATCTEAGYTGDAYCKLCDTKLSTGHTIPSYGHSWSGWTKVDETNHKRVCTNNTAHMESAAHRWNGGVITRESTCTGQGIKTYTCTDCGVARQESIAAKGHGETVVRNQKAATCTETGYTGDSYCQICNAKIYDGSVINALDHSFGTWYTSQNSTAVSEGQIKRDCTRCGHTEIQATARLVPTGRMNAANNLPLKIKQSVTLKVTDMAVGDYVSSWTSSNVKIVKVNGTGKITGIKKGSAKITATLASGKTITITVKVQKGKVKTSAVAVNTRKVTLKVGQKYQLIANRAPITSSDKISYSSKKSKIAAVSKTGKITAKKTGTTTITVKSGKKSVKVTVKVVKQ